MGDGKHYAEDVATGGDVEKRLAIGGRIRQGKEVLYVLCEEPGPQILMHWRKPNGNVRGQLVPHFKRDCKNCLDCDDEPKPLWYVGALERNRDPVILELTDKCFEVAEAAAKTIGVQDGVDLFGEPIGDLGRFAGLIVKIQRGGFPFSPRVLRCEQRCQVTAAWPYDTRKELARIWRIPTRPKLYKAEGA